MGRHTIDWFGQTFWYEIKPPSLQPNLQVGMTTTVGRANLSMYEVFEVPHPFIRGHLQGETVAWVTPSIAMIIRESKMLSNSTWLSKILRIKVGSPIF